MGNRQTVAKYAPPPRAPVFVKASDVITMLNNVGYHAAKLQTSEGLIDPVSHPNAMIDISAEIVPIEPFRSIKNPAENESIPLARADVLSAGGELSYDTLSENAQPTWYSDKFDKAIYNGHVFEEGNLIKTPDGEQIIVAFVEYHVTGAPIAVLVSDTEYSKVRELSFDDVLRFSQANS
jgi:hypothetical protein